MSKFQQNVPEYNQWVADFHWISVNDKPHKRNKNHTLYTSEPVNNKPSNWNIEIGKQYKAIVTFNKKYHDKYKDEANIHYLQGAPIYNRHDLPSFKSFNEKIDGVCILARIRPQSKHPCEIYYKRLEVLDNIRHLGSLQAHWWGTNIYGLDDCHIYNRDGELINTMYYDGIYMGPVGNTDEERAPGSLQKMQKIDEYKFCLSFEHIYDEFWSYGYTSGNMFDVFRSKTVCVYYGMYNVEEFIPKELFIDYRDFEDDRELNDHLMSMSEKKYREMVEDAFVYQATTDFCQLESWNEMLRRFR